MIDTKALRQKILDMAIRGELVPQDKADEPANVLLEEIRAEKKEQLGKKYVDSYIYKSSGGYLEHTDGKEQDEAIEVPFDIPDSWAWARWGELSYSIQYGFNAPAKESGRIKMVRISDIHNNKVDWDNVPFCDIEEKEISTYLLKENDILFARTGGTVGKSYLVAVVPEDAIYAGYLIRTRYSNKLSAQYLKYFMESSLYWLQLRDGTIATAQPNCNGQTLSKMILPIPPLAEQQRIVARVEELFAQIDVIDSNQADIDTLYGELKKRTLDLAVRGNLVPQDETDEPASVLLEKIRAEKKAKAGKKYVDSYIYKNGSGYFEHIDGKEQDEAIEVPFEIPDSWAWSRVSEIAVLQSGKPFEETESGIYYIKVSDMNIPENATEITTSQHYCIAKKAENVPLYSVIFPKRGGAISTNKKRKVISINCCIDLNTMCMTPFVPQTLEYIYQWFLTIDLGTIHDGTSVPQINNVDIYPLFIPIPPLAEQQRIVDKVNAVFAQLKDGE